MSKPQKIYRLGVLAIEGALMASLGFPQDAMMITNALAEIRGDHQAPKFEAIIITPRKERSIRLASGMILRDLAAPPNDLDAILIPGIMHKSIADLLEIGLKIGPEARYLKAEASKNTRLIFGCCSSFLFAHTGLLNGRRATTSWWLAASFRKHYPQVLLEPDAMQIDDGSISTVGAGSAEQDFILRLIREQGNDALAQQTRRMMMLDTERQSQAPYLSDAMLEQPRDSMSEKAVSYLQKNLAKDFTVFDLAEHCGTTERSLLRHFRTQFNLGPREYIQRLRIERAKLLLESTQLTLDEIMARCGYFDLASFRKLFKRESSMTPGEYRDRFRLRASA